MCDKRPLSYVEGLPFKRFKESTTINENGSTVSGNDRVHPVNDFDKIFEETEPTSLQYTSKIPLQPEELLLYCLVNAIIPLSKSSFPFQPEKYFYVSKAIYIVYGVRFNCKSIQNYFYRRPTTCKRDLESLTDI